MIYSKQKPIGYNIRNGLIKQKRLTVICLILTFACILWNIWNELEIADFYRLSIGVSDILIDMQRSESFGIMIFPLLIFYILKCKQDSLNFQIVLRYGSRNRMLRNQLKESGIYAVAMSTLLILSESLISFYFLRDWTNWENSFSKFYMETGYLSDISFLEIAAVTWLMYILKFLLILFLMDMLLWYPKYMVLIWIPVLLAYALDLPDMQKFYVFHRFYCMSYSYGITRGVILVPLLVGLLLLIAEYLIGTLFIQKKDLFR